jgi:hypothetical protein
MGGVSSLWFWAVWLSPRSRAQRQVSVASVPYLSQLTHLRRRLALRLPRLDQPAPRLEISKCCRETYSRRNSSN